VQDAYSGASLVLYLVSAAQRLRSAWP